MRVPEALALIHAAIDDGKRRGDVYAEMADEAVKALEKVLETDDEYGVNPGARTRLESALVRIASKLEGK